MTDTESAADSYGAFVAETKPRLAVSLCAAFGPDVGSEATSHALEQGWRHWHRVQSMDNPAGYLWAIGRNHARRQLRRKPVVLPDVRSDGPPWVEPELPRALERLSARERVAVILVKGLGWSYSEVAQLLGVKKGSVQSYVDRGMAKLRESIGVGYEHRS